MSELQRLLKVYEHPEGTKFNYLEDTVSLSLDYIQATVDEKIVKLKGARFVGPDIYRASLNRAQRNRRNSYKRLADCIVRVNQLCDRLGEERVCDGEYRNFAMQLVEQVYGGQDRRF